MTADNSIARLRMGLVVGPRASSQIRKGLKRAVLRHDHFGEIDRPALVALSSKHGSRQRLNGWLAAVSVFDVWQATHKRNIGSACQLSVIRAYGEFRWIAKL